MLDQIRSNSQSFGVKLAFGIIILVFVFWGIGSLTDTGSINVVAMVNNQPITFQQFETAYRQAEEQEKKEKEVAERKALAAEVDAARKAFTEAQKNYHDKLAAFVDKYHTYHYSTSDPDEVPTLFDIFNKIFPF